MNMKMKIKQGDTVYVIAGKEKGKTGEVIKINAKKNTVLIQGINMVKKHIKPNPNAGIEGGINSIESPIHASNIQIYNQITKIKDKIEYKVNKDGKKIRIFKSDKEAVDIS